MKDIVYNVCQISLRDALIVQIKWTWSQKSVWVLNNKGTLLGTL